MAGNFDRRAREGDDRLKALYDAGDAAGIVRELAEFNPSDPVLGAEINSIQLLAVEQKLVEPNARIHLCVSDTDEGRRIGAILRAYWADRKHKVDVHAIDGLQDRNPEKFKRIGLRNLVKEIARIVREAGGSEFVAIDATGGYKAQVAIAVLLGQAFGLPVYYRHERFASIISFPPIPIAFDYALIGEHDWLLGLLERADIAPVGDGDTDDDRLRALIDVEAVDGAEHAALTPLGQLFVEGYRAKFPPDLTLPASASEVERKEPRFRDDHYPDGFRQYVTKVWQDCSYIKTCVSADYAGQPGIKHGRIRIDPNYDGDIIGEYNKNSFGARFKILTTATTEQQKIAVVHDMNGRFGA
jgi:putative CRISPR-associated protein (TIGR02619 family)